MITRTRAARVISGLFATGGTIRQKAIRGTVWTIFSQWLTKPVQFIQTIIVARVLNPSDLGLMGLLYVVVGTINVFVAPGMQSALVQRKEVDRNALNTAWVVSILGSLVKSVLIFFSAQYAAAFYNSSMLEQMLKIFALGYVIGGFRNVGMVLYRRDIDMRMITIAQQLSALIQVFVTVVLVLWLRNVWALVIGSIVGEAITLIVSFILSPYRPSFEFDYKLARGLFRFGRHILLTGIILLVIEKGDRALLGKVLDLEAVGYYGMAYALAILPSTFLTGIIHEVLFPVFSRLNDQVDSLRRTFLTVLRFLSLITIPASIGIGVLAPEIVEVVYGSKWLPMVDSLRVLCVFGMIRSVVTLSGTLFQGTGKPHYLTAVSFAQLVIMAVMIYPLTKTYHILGASIAVTVPMVLVQGWALMKSAEIIGEKLSVILSILSLPLLGTVVMIVTLSFAKNYLFTQTTVHGLLSLVILGAVTYMSTIILFDRKVLTELKALSKLTGEGR
jgi:O-antigen/teichoic acid export membrane protein